MDSNFDKIVDKLSKISPDIATCIDTCTHSISRREILDKKTCSLIKIASLTTLGSSHKTLKRSIHDAIDLDCSVDEILETMLQISFSCGLSRSIDAIFEAKKVFEDRDLLTKKSKDDSFVNEDEKSDCEDDTNKDEKIECEKEIKLKIKKSVVKGND